MYQFQQNLRHIKKKVKQWNEDVFGNIIKDKKDLEQHMDELKKKIIQQAITNEMKEEEMDLQKIWEERSKQDEELWQQKSSIHWLKCGERNSSFFQFSMIQHRRNNIILSLRIVDRRMFNSHEDISRESKIF